MKRFGRVVTAVVVAVMVAVAVGLMGCDGDNGTGGGGNNGGNSTGGNNTGGNNTNGNNTNVSKPVSVLSGDTLTYDGQKYRTVVIDGKRWMAENLNYQTDSSWCYENNTDSCAKYGRLYVWKAAMSACPNGWKLPSREEWEDLKEAVGGYRIAGKMLKATSGWNVDGNGTDEYGFSALPGGRRQYNGVYLNVGDYGSWWTAYEYCTGTGNCRDGAYCNEMSNNLPNVFEWGYYKFIGRSVRCIKE
jgi:uncharacterized protein (TIGR02145 family)